MAEPVRVLVVDDSAVVRQVMTELLQVAGDIKVIGTASDPLFALDKMRREWPDVITLDIEMPRMDGLTFLRQIMAERPTPVVICSSLTIAGSKTAMQALDAGAFTVITKPLLGVKDFLTGSAAELIAAVRAAAKANVGNLMLGRPSVIPSVITAASSGQSAMVQTTERIVALGTSTGGTQALERVLTGLPRVCPGIVIVQHMPERFTELFAQRLNSICELEVAEAHDGQRILPGLALIAPGGRQMQVRRSGAYYYVDVKPGPPVNRHCPSVDVLFRSVAKAAGRNAMGVIMTGMGDDGARGLKEMRDAGSWTLAQDEASSVVYGMPKEAVKLGGAIAQIGLGQIAAAILAGPSAHL
ncbi:MAG: chemotaxis response regulator protein-glutamate methylesterase [Gammaproteobacteria bacterium]|nr:chemotaxis response regulator protein-glutamate methylesterase [Gammaproteobacteria bacterium]